MSDNAFEVLKMLVGPAVTVGLAWLVGYRISAAWSHRQKRREQSLTTTAEFYRLYGDFFAVWKLANFAFRDSSNELPKEARWDLMRRATTVEASGEALLLRIGTELTLTPDQVKCLGMFRQGTQRLRQSIVKQKPLDWITSEHAEYVEFKRLAVEVGRLAAAVGTGRPPDIKTAQHQVLEITSNKWEKTWDDLALGQGREQPALA